MPDLKASHTLGNVLAATLETTKGHLMNLIMTMRFMISFFEVSSVAATMLPGVWRPLGHCPLGKIVAATQRVATFVLHDEFCSC